MFEIFKKYSELVVAISQKEDGNMKLTENPEADEEAVRNRIKFLGKLKISIGSTIKIVPGHGSEIEKVSLWHARKIITRVDGLITDKKGVFLTISVADCLPVFLWSPKKKALGLIHCGWQGLARGILGNAVGEIIDNFSVYPENLLAGIGPGIGPCHFEVKADVLKKISADYLIAGETLFEKASKIFLDLKKITQLQLKEVGVKTRNIEINSECTFCEGKYFSHRRSGGEETMLVVFGKS